MTTLQCDSRRVSNRTAWRPPRLACGYALRRAACVGLLFTMTGTLWGDDSVYFSTTSPNQSAIKRTGTIVDWTGQAIRLQAATGVARSYPAAEVICIETVWTAAQQIADAAQARGDFAGAIAAYRRAAKAESRPWAQRRILAELTRCYAALDQFESAGETFLTLVRKDPTLPHLDALPLAWRPGELVPRRKAQDWLAQTETSAAVLLGASHLLATGDRPKALAALERLTTAGGEARIAQLAEAQTWRTQLLSANEAQVTRWRRQTEGMPESIRAGPFAVVGRGYLRLGQWEAAALVFMHVPILHRGRPDLVAQTLLSAADALQQLGRKEESRRLLNDVVDLYAHTNWHAEAATRLQAAESQPPGKDPRDGNDQ